MVACTAPIPRKILTIEEDGGQAMIVEKGALGDALLGGEGAFSFTTFLPLLV